MMMNSECNRESEVIQAIIENNWPGELRLHVDSCVPCRISEQLFTAFQQIKTETEKYANIPRFEHILIESELQKETHRLQNFNRLISLSAFAAAAAGFILITLFNPHDDWMSVRRLFSFFNFQTVASCVLLFVIAEAPLHLFLKTRLKIL